ncbi:MAG TPA: hypothetical protein VED20_08960 [Streptosporangiaceae bacterium]|nr:hypothetical protein [Streptosporangiaceae bacterium]
MNLEAVRRMADAILYEGYILYPYRASAGKNRSRWQFGVVMAPGYAAADRSERSFTQTECVLEHTGQPVVEVILRFLQVQRRTTDPASPGAAAPAWDEAVEREVLFTVGGDQLLGQGGVREFGIPGGEDREPPAREAPGDAGGTVRRREPLAGVISVATTPVPGPWQAVQLQVRVENRTAADPVPRLRDEALPTALIAAHLIITVSGAEFISMTDPPEWAKPAVTGCDNVGCWPVLADPDGGRRVMLSSPIILYDHPELAPESPGELYDGTEIDEILTLRTLALSDDEKLQARATDPRAAALIDRVESLDAAAMRRLHGTIRAPDAGAPAAGDPDPSGGQARQAVHLGASGALHPGAPGALHPGAPGALHPGASGALHPGAPGAGPWWDPDADAAVHPDTDSVIIGGRRVARGSRVRLRPGRRRSDAQDMFLAGRIAEVQAVLLDVDDTPYLAVSLADDPDEDIRISHGRFLYFMTDEVEACEAMLSEAGPSEAGPSEAGASEAGPSEAGPSEAGPSEAGPSEAGL